MIPNSTFNIKQNVSLYKGIVAFIFTAFAGAIYAQDFNHEYRLTTNESIITPLGKSIVELNDGSCGVATVNSVYDDFGYTDFLVTFLKPTGDLIASYTFGNPNANESCNSICNSIDYNDQFLLCGKSKNDQMLIMKIDIYGNVIWSKELTFSYVNSEAITIFPVYNNYNDRGYVVVGNSNSVTGVNSVAAAKIDENGNVIWSKEYNMGVKMLMTDAIARKQYNDRVISIVGFQQYAGIFYLNIYEANGSIFYYPGANYELNTQIPIFNPQLTEVTDGNQKSTAISVQRDAFSANSVGIYLFKINGYDNFTPQWAKHYEQVDVHGYINGDLITNSDNEIVLTGSLNTDITFGAPYIIQIVHPYVLNTDFSGNLLEYRDFDQGEYEFAGSAIESCNSGEIVFNGANLNWGVQWDIKVIKQNSGGLIDCAEVLDWTQIDEKVIKSPLNMTEINVGTPSNYAMTAMDKSFDKYDCNGGQVYRPIQGDDSYTVEHSIQGSAGIGENSSEENWFYPNPVSGSLMLNISSNQEEITLYATNGILVLKGLYNNGDVIDISAFSPGIYMIERKLTSGEFIREKLVIQ